MSNFDRRVTLKIDRPRQPILAYGAVLFVLACLLIEAIARTPLVQSRVPYQAYGMNHPQLELQINMLQQYVEQNGAPDCFILGSSQAFREVDPGGFAQIFNKTRNDSLNCYNFGVTGSQIWSTSILGEILIQRYQPRLVILGTSFLDYTEGRELQIDERFKQNDWLEYQTGKFTFNGWLSEHSYGWRTITSLSYSAPFGMHYDTVLREAHKWDGEIARNGFALSTKSVDPNLPVEEGFVKNFKEEFRSFGVSERNLTALEEIVAFSRAQGAQVLLVEMVYHPALLDLKDSRGTPRADRENTLAFIDKVNARLADIAAEHHVIFLKFDPALPLPESGWFDLYHLNRNGAGVFSNWLGTQAARILDLPPSLPLPSEGN